MTIGVFVSRVVVIVEEPETAASMVGEASFGSRTEGRTGDERKKIVCFVS